MTNSPSSGSQKFERSEQSLSIANLNNHEVEVDSTVGIDQFIGDESMLNKDYGTEMIKAFVKKLFDNPLIQKIITDVDPNNLRAKNCYEKSGFVAVKEIITPEGIGLLMEHKR